jgi:hypothetical protein
MFLLRAVLADADVVEHEGAGHAGLERKSV